MFERTVDHIGDDFHFTVRVQWETAGGRDRVVIENAQGPEIHIIRIMIMVKGEMPIGAKPIGLSVITVFGANSLDHIAPPDIRKQPLLSLFTII
jgi:hypothetical protein